MAKHRAVGDRIIVNHNILRLAGPSRKSSGFFPGLLEKQQQTGLTAKQSTCGKVRDIADEWSGRADKGPRPRVSHPQNRSGELASWRGWKDDGREPRDRLDDISERQ